MKVTLEPKPASVDENDPSQPTTFEKIGNQIGGRTSAQTPTPVGRAGSLPGKAQAGSPNVLSGGESASGNAPDTVQGAVRTGQRAMKSRCTSTFTRRSGEVLRCENKSGHDSVHYNGDVWWPNKRGLPRTGEKLPWYLRLLHNWLNKP